MVPVDVPQAAHDMILRFMEVNFTALVDGSARIPSAIGTDAKPIFTEDHETKSGTPVSTKTPQQDKAMWEGRFYLHREFEITEWIFIFSLLQCWIGCTRPSHCVPHYWWCCVVPS